MTPDIALVIGTRHRAGQLHACLEALAQTDCFAKQWELVVVNNGGLDDERTNHVVRSFACTVPFRVVLVQEPRPGLSRARNAGILATRAPLIACTDDDCYLEPDYLPEVLRAFARQPTLGYLGGQIRLYDKTDAPETVKEDVLPLAIPGGAFLPPGSLHGANMAFRRAAWMQVGGFDPQLGPGTRFCADDIDFLARVSGAGWEGRYCPQAVVWHHHGRKPGPAVDRLRAAYARGRGAYYVKGWLGAGRRRREWARLWYWHLRTQGRNRRVGELAREFLAGVEYLGRRAVSRPTRSAHAGVQQAHQPTSDSSAK